VLKRKNSLLGRKLLIATIGSLCLLFVLVRLYNFSNAGEFEVTQEYSSGLPKQLILKQGEITLAVMTACEPSGEMFWIACDFAPTETYAETGVLVDEASNTPDTDEGHARFEEIYAGFHDSGIRLINPDTQVYFRYWIMHHHPDNKVTIRWAEEVPLD
jgi:hypothetical protein